MYEHFQYVNDDSNAVFTSGSIKYLNIQVYLKQGRKHAYLILVERRVTGNRHAVHVEGYKGLL